MTGQSTDSTNWSDEPRDLTDIGGRPNFAAAVADQVKGCAPGDNSTVFGLVGPWGSGKTTLLNDVISRLPGWSVVHFTPWSAADSASITSEFVAALSEAFPESSSIYKKLAGYARFGTPALRAIPVVGDAAEGLVDAVLQQYAQGESWHAAYEKIANETADQNKRVLVVIDDVDRLHSEELYALLRVVRLLGRFKNVHYILAYDEATLNLTLKSTPGATSAFMEKIVQYPFEVPPVSAVERRRWSREIVDEFGYKAAGSNEKISEHSDFVSSLAKVLETPRAVSRLKHQLRTTQQLAVDAEIYGPDFIALSWIRITQHSVWDDLRLHPDIYTGWRVEEAGDVSSQRRERIKDLISDSSFEGTYSIISFLFAPSPFGGGLTRAERRLREPRYFERYFQIGIADDDVSEDKVDQALVYLLQGTENSHEVAYFRAAALSADPDKAMLALEHARTESMRSDTTSPQRLSFVREMHTTILTAESADATRSASIDKWLAHELYRAIRDNVLTIDQVIQQFGYDQIIGSAYYARRSGSSDSRTLQEIYLPYCRAWLDTVAPESLEVIASRPETYLMTSFSQSSAFEEGFRGYLSNKISTVDDLLTLGRKFVVVGEWVGTGTRYEPTFDFASFQYAVSEKVLYDFALEVMELEGPLHDAEVGIMQNVPTDEEIYVATVQGIAKLSGDLYKNLR